MNQRFCPKCAHEVSKTQRYLRNWMWAKWKCDNCGTLLGFSQRRRFLMILINVIVIGLAEVINFRWKLDLGWWIWGWIIVTTLLGVPLVDEIVEIRRTD
jgi:uncharacterized protein (DUF983 family)